MSGLNEGWSPERVNMFSFLRQAPADVVLERDDDIPQDSEAVQVVRFTLTFQRTTQPFRVTFEWP